MTEKIIGEQFVIGEFLAGLCSGLWLHSQEWLCYKNHFSATRVAWYATSKRAPKA